MMDDDHHRDPHAGNVEEKGADRTGARDATVPVERTPDVQDTEAHPS
jgi:hypothetical protein